jgi:hypothetical protein
VLTENHLFPTKIATIIRRTITIFRAVGVFIIRRVFNRFPLSTNEKPLESNCSVNPIVYPRKSIPLVCCTTCSRLSNIREIIDLPSSIRRSILVRQRISIRFNLLFISIIRKTVTIISSSHHLISSLPNHSILPILLLLLHLLFLLILHYINPIPILLVQSFLPRLLPYSAPPLLLLPLLLLIWGNSTILSSAMPSDGLLRTPIIIIIVMLIVTVETPRKTNRFSRKRKKRMPSLKWNKKNNSKTNIIIIYPLVYSRFRTLGNTSPLPWNRLEIFSPNICISTLSFPINRNAINRKTIFRLIYSQRLELEFWLRVLR